MLVSHYSSDGQLGTVIQSNAPTKGEKKTVSKQTQKHCKKKKKNAQFKTLKEIWDLQVFYEKGNALNTQCILVTNTE